MEKNKKMLLIGGAAVAAIVVYMVIKNRSKAAVSVVNTAIPAYNIANNPFAYNYAVQKQVADIKKSGSSSINLADPSTWPSMIV